MKQRSEWDGAQAWDLMASDSGTSEWIRAGIWVSLCAILALLAMRFGWIAGWKVPFVVGASLGAAWVGETLFGPGRERGSLRRSAGCAACLTVLVSTGVWWWNP